MLDQVNQFTHDHSIRLELKKKLLAIMGQLINYLTSVFSVINPVTTTSQKKQNNHVTFADNSFAQALNRNANEQAAKLDSLRQSNRRTIFTYEFITIVAFLLHFSMVLWPKVQLESFSILQPEGWQLITINLIPAFVQFVAIYAMIDLNRELPEGSKLTAKNSGLELDRNDFVKSLKVVVSLVAVAQVAALYSEQLLWSVILILPFWCFQLTTRLAKSEFDQHAPSPKKSWVKLSSAKSPKATTPSKSTQQQQQQQQQQGSAKKDLDTKATPRTRTRRAVKSFISNASDKYHQLEQSVAQQISTLQNMGSPLRRDNKAIEY